MSQPKINIPRKHLAQFCRQHQIVRLSLFGSVLTESFHPESDVDVLVKFDPSARVSFIKLSRMQRELSQLFERPVDLVPQDGLKATIRESVLASAQVIYAA